jgi:hypothetical protein
MPSKLAENIDEKNGASILRFAGKRRFLKLF